MKKTTRKIAAFIAAMTLTACAMAPMSMVSYAADVTITNIGSVAHTFEVYQVFTGTYNSTDGTFSALKWGTGVSKYNGNTVTKDALVDATIVSTLGQQKATDILSKIETNGVKACDDVTSSGGTATITGLADGYYIIKDVTNLDDEYDANSSYIVQVAAAGKTTSLSIKNEIPTIDKQIEDNDDTQATGEDVPTGDNNGWGESADHAINDTFRFRLLATIPVDADNLPAYETYKVVFNDKMSSGVTYEEIESVRITSTSVDLTLTESQYTATTPDPDGNNDWTLTITDVKALVNANDADVFGKEEIKIEVIYKAHLNEGAIIDDDSRENGDATTTNNNMVYLQYSNNPDGTGAGAGGLGQTTEDYVWAYTYKLNNTKYKVEAKDGNELEGAKFQILNGSTAIKLIDNGDGTYTVADQSADVTTDEDTTNKVVDTMISNATGIFDIKGLDAGTYTLVETFAPEGYNKAPDTTFSIGATHLEDTNGTADLYLSGLTEEVENKIVDTMNNSLPSTGGVGTTMFVLGGGCLVALSGIYLISKKRAKDNSAE